MSGVNEGRCREILLHRNVPQFLMTFAPLSFWFRGRDLNITSVHAVNCIFLQKMPDSFKVRAREIVKYLHDTSLQTFWIPYTMIMAQVCLPNNLSDFLIFKNFETALLETWSANNYTISVLGSYMVGIAAHLHASAIVNYIAKDENGENEGLQPLRCLAV